MSNRSKMFPPRLRDWESGTPQVGIFIRTAKGNVLEYVNDKASDATVRHLVFLFRESAEVAAVHASLTKLSRALKSSSAMSRDEADEAIAALAMVLGDES